MRACGAASVSEADDGSLWFRNEHGITIGKVFLSDPMCRMWRWVAPRQDRTVGAISREEAIRDFAAQLEEEA
jgi:hypothetical protein